MSLRMELLRRRSAGKTEIQPSPSVHCFAGKTENKTSPSVHCFAGKTENKTSPSGRIMRERHKIKTSPQRAQSAGNTEFQSFPCCGEDTTPKGVKISPRIRVVTGVGKDGLTAQPALSLPPPRDKGSRKKKDSFAR